jgi:hypothetical protein
VSGKGISEVFREPVAGAPLAEHHTMLETLQAGIAGQLAVLPDFDQASAHRDWCC